MDVSELIRKEGLIRKLSPRTIKTYCVCVEKFFRVCRKDPRKVTTADIKKYILQLAERDAPSSTINAYLSALKFFYEQILRKRLTINIRNARKAKKLPEYLTKEETTRLLQEINNKKHRLMILLMYSAGLRVSELVHLKVRDLQLDKNYGWVREGKGKKDRLFIIAETLKSNLRTWIEENQLTSSSWLFPSYNQSRHLSTRTIYQIVKRAAKSAEIVKNVHPHTLRHSFATHLVENGYAITEVQPLLGHNRLETTLVYTHMATPTLLKVKSPLDGLNDDKII